MPLRRGRAIHIPLPRFSLLSLLSVFAFRAPSSHPPPSFLDPAAASASPFSLSEHEERQEDQVGGRGTGGIGIADGADGTEMKPPRAAPRNEFYPFITLHSLFRHAGKKAASCGGGRLSQKRGKTKHNFVRRDHDQDRANGRARARAEDGRGRTDGRLRLARPFSPPRVSSAGVLKHTAWEP